jgi:hypothetical protein
MSEWHVPAPLLERYAAFDGLPAPDLWSAEAHLERCPECRARLAGLLPSCSPGLLTLVGDVQAELAGRIAAMPVPAPASRWGAARRLAGGLLGSRLVACIAVLLAAAVVDVVAGSPGDAPSWIVLVAPALPLFGVAAGWSRELDPAWDLVATTPAAGLRLLLWRTLAVLAVVVPAALVAGVATGAGGVVTWLLPCFGLTAAALALGGVLPMARATALAGAAWAAGVVAPALAAQATPALLEPGWAPAWATLTIAAAALVALRRTAYLRPEEG